MAKVPNVSIVVVVVEVVVDRQHVAISAPAMTRPPKIAVLSNWLTHFHVRGPRMHALET